MHEIREAGMAGADRTPDKAKQHQAQHRITGQYVQTRSVVLDKVGGHEGSRQCPVKHADKWASDANRVVFMEHESYPCASCRQAWRDNLNSR